MYLQLEISIRVHNPISNFHGYLLSVLLLPNLDRTSYLADLGHLLGNPIPRVPAIAHPDEAPGQHIEGHDQHGEEGDDGHDVETGVGRRGSEVQNVYHKRHRRDQHGRDLPGPDAESVQQFAVREVLELLLSDFEHFPVDVVLKPTHLQLLHPIRQEADDFDFLGPEHNQLIVEYPNILSNFKVEFGQ